MRTRILPVLALLGAAFPQDEFKWETDLDAATKAAAAGGKPLLIVFR